ncbi:MAG: DUF1449 family protein [Armatimonadetes bacterium]|nr:DUF1449 family protein [Armatimonadota bacterium]
MLADWVQWYYLIYLLPLGLAFVLLLASALASGGDGDGDADASGLDTGDASHDFEGLTADAPAMEGMADAHGPFDGHLLSVETAHATDPHADSAHHESHDSSMGQQLLLFFGIGRAPLTLLLQGFLLTWGVVGFYVTRMLSEQWRDPAWFVPVGMVTAGLSGLLGMKLLGAVGSRYLKPVESYAMRQDDLLGEIGTVIYPVTETSGRVHVYDRHGTLHIESCRIGPGEEAIPRNAKVLLVRHDPQRDLYRVELSPL